MNRRDFFHPSRIGQVAGQFLGAVQELSEAPAKKPVDAEAAFFRASRSAMATNFEILLPFGSAQALGKTTTFLEEIDRLEDQLSVYRDWSEVSRLNQSAASAAVPVEGQLFSLFQLAGRLWAQTEGSFDITAGALIKVWGFFRGPRMVPAEQKLAEALNRVGMQHVELEAERQTIRFLRPGLEINLGSVGKGYALDRAAQRLRDEWNVSSALLHGGHSSVYAIGTQPGDERGWSVGIRDPWKSEDRLAIVHLRDRAIGTSAATFQHLEYHGRRLGHILDPRTGWPAEGMASASAIANTAAEADALATAFFILGVEKTRRYCETHPGTGAILLTEEANPRLFIFGLRSEEYTIS